MTPICFISKDSTGISPHTTAEDRHDMSVVLNIVGDFAKDLNQKSFVQSGTADLYRLCEGRDANLDLLPDTVAAVLRKHQVLDAAKKVYIDVGNNQSIEYGVSTPARRGLFTVEAVMRVTIRHHGIRES
jgi:hypothetical protein